MLGLALYLTFSRGGLGAAAAGLAVLIALAPTRAQARAALLVAVAAAVPALATLALPAVAQEKSGSGQGAAMIALLLVTAAGAALLARRPVGAGTVVPRMRALAAGALLLALAATAIAVTQVERRGGRDEPEATPGRLASVQSNRYAYWKVALRAFGDHPVAGVGSGGFQAEWLRERPFREPVRDAHSLYLETPAELGLVGLALLLTLLGAVAVAAAPRRAGARGPGRGARRLRAARGRRLGLGAAGADARRARAGRARAGYQPGSERGPGWPSPMSAWLPLRRGTASPDGRPPARSSRTKKALTPASSVCTSR